jgi:hypothetical protein
MMHPSEAHDSASAAFSIKGNAAANEQVASLNRRVLELAGEEQWQLVAEVVARRDALLSRIPADKRAEALLAARHCTERLRGMAQAAKSQCAERLATLRQGRKAAESYRANR